MEISKDKDVPVIQMLEKVYILLLRDEKENNKSQEIISFIANMCIKLYPLYKDNLYFIDLFNHVYQQVAKSQLQNNAINGIDIDNQRSKLIYLIEQFELSLIKQQRFNIYFLNCNESDLPIKIKNFESIEMISLNENTSSFEKNKHNFSVLIYSDQSQQLERTTFDFYFDIKSIIESKNSLITKLNQLDYYKHDRFYLEAKLNSLKKRQDIRLLLAGSSYTMCGLFENQMPLPARNIAIDAQDLYYSIKSIRTALEYNPNITHCILSFAYYFWGYDLSLSTSLYQYKRVTEVNYPVFKDKHNFSGVIEDGTQTFLTSITPLKKYLFSFEKIAEQKIEKLKESFEDANYFPNPRVGSAVLQNDDGTNRQLAQKRAASHNKFFKYHSTVQENIELFTRFLGEMNSRGIQIILYVPPVTEYYRNYINPELISNYYECMEPLKSKFQFKLIDLFNCDEFENSDFYDYDHLNDQGAEKLGKILGKELEI